MSNLQNTFVTSLLGCTVSGGACRFSFMAVFTVVVFLFVRYGHNGVVLRYVVLTVCVIWVINISLNAVVWSPQVITITIAKNVTCSPTLDDEGGLPFLIMYIFLYGILSHAVTIVIPILSCLYIRHRSISGDLKSQKALVRFTLFLVIGNTISFIGQIVLVVITEALPEGDSAEEALLENIVLTAEGWLVFFPLSNISSHFTIFSATSSKKSVSYVLVNTRESGRREAL